MNVYFVVTLLFRIQAGIALIHAQWFAGRCAVCVGQRKGNCGTSLAPTTCLRRQAAAGERSPPAAKKRPVGRPRKEPQQEFQAKSSGLTTGSAAAHREQDAPASLQQDQLQWPRKCAGAGPQEKPPASLQEKRQHRQRNTAPFAAINEAQDSALVPSGPRACKRTAAARKQPTCPNAGTGCGCRICRPDLSSFTEDQKELVRLRALAAIQKALAGLPGSDVETPGEAPVALQVARLEARQRQVAMEEHVTSVMTSVREAIHDSQPQPLAPRGLVPLPQRSKHAAAAAPALKHDSAAAGVEQQSLEQQAVAGGSGRDANPSGSILGKVPIEK